MTANRVVDAVRIVGTDSRESVEVFVDLVEEFRHLGRVAYDMYRLVWSVPDE